MSNVVALLGCRRNGHRIISLGLSFGNGHVEQKVQTVGGNSWGGYSCINGREGACGDPYRRVAEVQPYEDGVGADLFPLPTLLLYVHRTLRS